MKLPLWSALSRLSVRTQASIKIMQSDIPRTLAATEAVAKAARPRVFDPALKHYARAFALGEAASVSAHERLEWERARAAVRAHLLALVANSAWRDHLILRGSVLMRHWFGEAARDPKDIDWVFTPSDVKLGDATCRACLDDLVRLVRENPRAGEAQILAERIAWDDIWTYERAAGRRLVFPFSVGGGAMREIQMDIVWGETMPQPPILTAIATRGGSPQLLAATPETSLAWKLLWLAGDMHPQGKDLYDAVLLAESYAVWPALLREVFDGDEFFRRNGVSLQTFRELSDIDWPNFLLDYLWIEGTVEQWHARLLAALEPMLA